MDNKNKQVIEPEIIDEEGKVVEYTSNDHARPKGDNGGILGGLLTLACGFFMTILFFVFSLIVIVPAMLIGRIFGIQIKRFK